MIVAKAGHTSDGSCGILAPVETDESKALKCGRKTEISKTHINERVPFFSQIDCSSGLVNPHPQLLYVSLGHKSLMFTFHISHLRLACVLVFSQIDPRDGTERSEKFLQICFPGVLGQVGHTDCSIIISCKDFINVLPCCTDQCLKYSGNIKHRPLRLGCIDSPLRVLPSRRLGGTYFPVLLWTG